MQADELQVDAALCSSSVEEFKDEFEFEFNEITDDGALDSARVDDGARAHADWYRCTAATGAVTGSGGKTGAAVDAGGPRHAASAPSPCCCAVVPGRALGGTESVSAGGEDGARPIRAEGIPACWS